VEHSRDAYNTLAAKGWLGYAYLEKGDAREALPLLGWAADQGRQFGYKAIISWFYGWWSEALRLTGDTEKARDVALQGLELASEGQSLYGAGFARRVLGRLAQAAGDHAGAKDHLRGALDAFAAVESRFEVGRSHLDLAALARARGDGDSARTHVQQARAIFGAWPATLALGPAAAPGVLPGGRGGASKLR
jgi:tetratricopeptide (TPR) repeat protein